MFSTTMFQMGNNTAIEVPADVVAAFGAGKRPPVVVRVNDRVPIDRRPMGGMYLLPFSAERRGSGIRGGDAIDVKLTLDTAPAPSKYPRICRPRSTPRRAPRPPGTSRIATGSHTWQRGGRR